MSFDGGFRSGGSSWCHLCRMAIRQPRSARRLVWFNCHGGFVEELEMGNDGAEEEEEAISFLARFGWGRPFSPDFLSPHGHVQNDEFRTASLRDLSDFGMMMCPFLRAVALDLQESVENDPGRRRPPPASRASVDALEEVKVSGKDAASQCVVCQDEFEVGKYAKRMPCCHMYHADCILPWLALHNSCPLCRIELPTEDPEYDRIHSRGRNETSSSGRRSHPRASMTTSQQAQAETSSGPGRSGETVSGLFYDTHGNSFSLDDDGDVIMQDASG